MKGVRVGVGMMVGGGVGVEETRVVGKPSILTWFNLPILTSNSTGPSISAIIVAS